MVTKYRDCLCKLMLNYMFLRLCDFVIHYKTKKKKLRVRDVVQLFMCQIYHHLLLSFKCLWNYKMFVTTTLC